MNIHDLRRNMLVYNFNTHSNGATIYYSREGKADSINLNSQELISALIAIGSLDENPDPEYVADYFMSQWDALNIAIRFEAARDMDKEIENSDIGKAINNLLNK